jgi:hypothetical protein
VAELSRSKLSNFGHPVTILNEARFSKFQGFKGLKVSEFDVRSMPHGVSLATLKPCNLEALKPRLPRAFQNNLRK